MGLSILGYAESSGLLRETYDRMLERPLPPVYRPSMVEFRESSRPIASIPH